MQCPSMLYIYENSSHKIQFYDGNCHLFICLCYSLIVQLAKKLPSISYSLQRLHKSIKWAFMVGYRMYFCKTKIMYTSFVILREQILIF